MAFKTERKDFTTSLVGKMEDAKIRDADLLVQEEELEKRRDQLL